MSKNVFLRALSLFFISILILPPAAWAALGAKEDTLEAEATSLNSTHTEKVLAQYNLHEMTAADLDVKQYAGKNGVVFAVSWRGKRTPDLQSLFGTYFQEYSQALQAPAHRRTRGGPNLTKSANLVVERSGHMRSLYGRAYVTSLMPAGVSADDIK